jgi:hypothetical protein
MRQLSRTKAAFLASALVFAGHLSAGDEPTKTLPASMYGQMKEGKKLEKVWIGPAYKKEDGFSFGKLDYKADNRDSALMDHVNTQMKSIAKDKSPFTLTLAITELTDKKFTGFGYAMGKATVEGKITNKAGEIVAAFTTKVKMPESPGGKDQRGCADAIVSAISKDLL